MAEEVEFRIEEMVPEVEEMERLGLLSNKEIKKLLEKRREYEYRLVKRIRRRHDYLDYCTYEKKLIELIKIRRKQIGMYEKPAKIEYPIAKRNLARLQYVTRVWPTEIDTWTSRIDFAKFMNWKQLVSLVYEDQTRFHGNHIGLWIAWAKYELEERNDFDATRKVLLSKALLHHPKSVQLKRELFRLELLYVEALHIKKKNNLGGLEEIIAENREKVLNCAVAEVVYRDAVKNLPEPEMFRACYMVASKFDFANQLREKIFKDFCRNFPKSESLYMILAIRAASGELDNIQDLEEKSAETNCESVKEPEEEVVNNLEKISVQEGKEDQNTETTMLADVKTDGTLEVNDLEPALETTNKMKPLEKLERIIEIFDKALENVGSAFVNSYMEELLSLLHQSWGLQEMADLVLNKIKDICTTYKESLSPLNYYVWYNVLKLTTSTPEAQRCVLEDGVKTHPNDTHLQLQLVKQLINVATTDDQKLKAFDRYSNTLKGKCGLELWEETIKHIADEELKESLFVRGTKHSNATVGHKMKSDYLNRTWANKGVQEAREVYKTLSWTPPFSMRIHADMMTLELKRNEVDVKRVREMFSNVLLQNGNKSPGVWLAYMQFEKKFGDPLLVGGLGTRAEDELDAKVAQIFRELLIDIGEDLGVLAKGKQEGIETVSYIENSKARQEAEKKAAQQTLVKLFEEEVSLAYTPNQERIKFFSTITTMKQQLKEGNKEEDAEDSSVWEEVLEVITGHKIVLNICKVKKTPKPKAEGKKKRKKDEYKLRDKLQIEESIDGRTEDVLKKLLESSETLQPEFLKQKSLAPYFHDKEYAMKQKQEKKKTKGSGWFAMQQPEMTEELKRDLEILQMRSVLDPTRHYKNKDMAVLPKYFQVGKVADSAIDFYSSRIPKKSRKRTLAEEIMNDEEALRYQKKKYTEIVASKQKRGKKMQQMKKGSTSKK